MSFALGRTADGALHRAYRIKVCNAETGTAVYDGFYVVAMVDQYVTMLTPKTVEKMDTGSYYYIIYASDFEWNQIGPGVQSEVKEYIRPTERIPAASNLRWQGKKLLYDYPESSRQYTDNMMIRVLYSVTEDGTYEEKQDSRIYNIELDDFLGRNMTEPGYYKVTIQMLTSDPQVRLSTDEVAESPVCHVTQ